MLVLPCEPSDVVGDQAAPGFDPPRIFFGLGIIPEWTIQLAGIGGVEPQHDGFGQDGLVILHTQNIVGAAGNDLGGDAASIALPPTRRGGVWRLRWRWRFELKVVASTAQAHHQGETTLSDWDRSTLRSVFPTADFGRSRTNSRCFGCL